MLIAQAIAAHEAARDTEADEENRGEAG
jgi:hypothetical protein